MKSGSEAFLDTHVFADHLTFRSKEGSFLLKCLESFDHCYTSVINIGEVLSACKTKQQNEKAKRAFYGVGLLGIPYRYSNKLGRILRHLKTSDTNSYRDALIIMMCSETKLQLVTFDPKRYLSLSKKFGVKVIGRSSIEETIFK
jgi:predicted nucleic acid-binding protein